MKRKVIQIAGSTQLVSLPRKWAQAHNIQRGQEIDVQEDGNKILVSVDSVPLIEKAEVDISSLGNMTHRVLGAYYRAGIDELKVSYDDARTIEKVYDSLNRETMVGFEVMEHGNNHCLLKHVSGETEDFESVLRRVFSLLLNMSTECLRLLKEKKFDVINTLSFLEKSNNRFTTLCRRTLNKVQLPSGMSVGPTYFIVESLENIADVYKYISQHYAHLANKKWSLDKDALRAFEVANTMIRLFYELYYKFDMKLLVELKKSRDEVIEVAHVVFEKRVSHADIWLMHHSLMLATLVFNAAGPYLVKLVKAEKDRAST